MLRNQYTIGAFHISIKYYISYSLRYALLDSTANIPTQTCSHRFASIAAFARSFAVLPSLVWGQLQITRLNTGLDDSRNEDRCVLQSGAQLVAYVHDCERKKSLGGKPQVH
jgi:hypothetical protein